jgi:flagellar protein FlaG
MDVNAMSPSAHGLPAPAPAIPVDQAAENRELVQAVKALNGTEMFGQNELTFQRDAQTKRMVIRVVNRQTKEVVSQVPPEYVLRLSEDLKSPSAPPR